MSIIFYDGNCKICNSTIFFLKKKTSLDFKPEPVFGGQSNLLTTFNLTNFDVLHSMWLISDSGEKYSGYYAFKYIFINYSKSFWYKFIFKLKISDILGPKVYKIFSRNRKHFGCQSNICSI